MNTYMGFFDLNISSEIFKDKTVNKIFNSLIQLGYKTIAINQTFNDSDIENVVNKKKKKGENKISSDIIPEPINLTKISEEFQGKLKILNRLTISISNQNSFHKLRQSENFKKYHILAAIPTNLSIYQYLCSTYDFDIFTFDPLNKIPFKLNRKMYNLSRGKKIFYELMYSPAILDSTSRKNIISTGHLYHALGKSDGIVISSGATNEQQIRSPYDIINLGLLFGLSEEQSKNALLNTCVELVTKADCRRYGKSVVIVKCLESLTKNNTKNEEIVSDNENEKDMDIKQIEPATKKMKCI